MYRTLFTHQELDGADNGVEWLKEAEPHHLHARVASTWIAAWHRVGI